MAATSGSSNDNNSTLVMDVESNKQLEESRWQKHCIYRVPARIRNMNSKAYHPQVVSLGPFHHGDPNLMPMEEHKRRAWQHVLRRTGRTAQEFTAAIEVVADQLESMYMDLGDEWRTGEGREKFLKMMIVDGCFMLELMGETGGTDRERSDSDYDPVFYHDILNNMALIRRDMLMLENQLPLLLLQKLVALESGNHPSDDYIINRMVQRFVNPSSRQPRTQQLCHHQLDVFRWSLLGPFPLCQFPAGNLPDDEGTAAAGPRSAVQLYGAGIRFKTLRSNLLLHIRFRRGVLSMPTMPVDDSTEYEFRNLMAFELLHVGAGKDVTEYVYFMDCIIQSANDVDLLVSKGFVQNIMGSSEDVAKIFHSLARDLALDPDSAVDLLLRRLNAYYRLPWEMWYTYLKKTYFSSPWAFLALLVGFFLLLMTVLQTVYTILSFYRDC